MKNKIKMLAIGLLITIPTFGSTDPDTTVNSIESFGSDSMEISSSLHLLSEHEAEFPGGESQFEEFVLSNIKYPVVAINQGIEGKVIVSFEISKEGAIQNINIIEGIGGGCDEEVIRILSSMPVWIPALQNGHPVKTTKKLSFHFKN